MVELNESGVTPTRLVVCDAVGKVVLAPSELLAGRQQIDLSGLPDGLYLVEVAQGEKFRIEKVIKQ